ncbi:MAG: hypothetical protein AAGB34_10980, partial [Planctomycetota bacterium]
MIMMSRRVRIGGLANRVVLGALCLAGAVLATGCSGPKTKPGQEISFEERGWVPSADYRLATIERDVRAVIVASSDREVLSI